MTLPSDALAASSLALAMEFIRSGLGSAQLTPADASSKALPRRMLFNLVFIILCLIGVRIAHLFLC
jgi:hypothetical protein